MKRFLVLISGFAVAVCIAKSVLADDRGVVLSVKSIESTAEEKGDAPLLRVALVLGNGAYKAGKLKNPVNDASLIAKTLRDLSFDVMELHDVGQKETRKAIRSFGKKLCKECIGFFYYAGHGVQVNGRNFIIPVDAEIEGEEDVEIDGIDVGAVLSKMSQAENRLNIVVLDACRNNPFSTRFTSSSRALQPNRGLAETRAPTGALIAYATSPGDVAWDGKGKNSTFTAALSQMMKTQGLTIEEVFKRTRSEVLDSTNGAQKPWEHSSLIGNNFYLTGSPLIGLDKPWWYDTVKGHQLFVYDETKDHSWNMSKLLSKQKTLIKDLYSAFNQRCDDLQQTTLQQLRKEERDEVRIEILKLQKANLDDTLDTLKSCLERENRELSRAMNRVFTKSASIYASKGNLKQAMKLLDSGNDLLKEHSISYAPDLILDLAVARARLFLDGGEHEQAVAVLKQVTPIENEELPEGTEDPDGEWEDSLKYARYYLARALWRSGPKQAQEAREIVRKLVRDHSEYLWGWRLLADIAIHDRDEQTLKRVIEVIGRADVWPETIKQYVGYLSVLSTRKSPRESKKKLESWAWTYNIRGWYHLKWKQFDKAEPYLTKCIDATKHPSKSLVQVHVYCQDNLAWGIVNSKQTLRYDEAMKRFDLIEKLIQGNESEYLFVYLDRAYSLMEMGRDIEAGQTIEKARKVCSENENLERDIAWFEETIKKRTDSR